MSWISYPHCTLLHRKERNHGTKWHQKRHRRVVLSLKASLPSLVSLTTHSGCGTSAVRSASVCLLAIVLSAPVLGAQTSESQGQKQDRFTFQVGRVNVGRQLVSAVIDVGSFCKNYGYNAFQRQSERISTSPEDRRRPYISIFGMPKGRWSAHVFNGVEMCREEELEPL